MDPRYLLKTELEGVTGAVVTIDVIRAFTTAAYAFAAGAREIYLVGTVEEALAFKAQTPRVDSCARQQWRRDTHLHQLFAGSERC